MTEPSDADLRQSVLEYRHKYNYKHKSGAEGMFVGILANITLLLALGSPDRSVVAIGGLFGMLLAFSMLLFMMRVRAIETDGISRQIYKRINPPEDPPLDEWKCYLEEHNAFAHSAGDFE